MTGPGYPHINFTDMENLRRSIGLLALLAVTTLSREGAAQCPGVHLIYPNTMTARYNATVLNNGIPNARGIAFDAEGNLLAVVTNVGVVLLKPIESGCGFDKDSDRGHEYEVLAFQSL